MKNLNNALRERLVAKYLEKDTPKNQPRSTNINVLLNRVKTNQKNESLKKILFSAAASSALVLFGIIIF
mgnify:FL=1|tara:strand:- start:5 stop:211 length:207 start_codon:yes stop_codon:yes gene_type:complete